MPVENHSTYIGNITSCSSTGAELIKDMASVVSTCPTDIYFLDVPWDRTGQDVFPMPFPLQVVIPGRWYV